MSMGLTSASLGISGLVFSQINDLYFKTDGSKDSTFDFLLFLGTVVAIVSFAGSFILGPLDRHEVVDLSADLIQQDDLVTQNLGHHKHASSISSFSTSSTQYEAEELDEERPLLSKNVIVSADNIKAIKKMNNIVEIEEEPNISGIAFFSDPVGYSLALALLIILGVGYVYLANIGQLLISLSPTGTSAGEAQHLRNMHVSIFSIANCGSRAVFGTLSDILQRRAGVHRLWFFWSAAIGLMISMIYMVTVVSTADQLISCTIMTAIVYGITFGIAPATISEFGTKVNILYSILEYSLILFIRRLLVIGVFCYVLLQLAVNHSMCCLV